MTTRILSTLVVVENKGLVLLLQRRPDDRSFKGWCFPGGRVDDGETELEAACRELLEETGIHERDDARYTPIGVFSTPLPERDRVYDIHAYKVSIEGETPYVALSDEHEHFGWFEPRSALTLELAGPTTRAIIENLLEEST